LRCDVFNYVVFGSGLCFVLVFMLGVWH
jgi:hypothetical protein